MRIKGDQGDAHYGVNYGVKSPLDSFAMGSNLRLAMGSNLRLTLLADNVLLDCSYAFL
jgi:hypothetical protein